MKTTKLFFAVYVVLTFSLCAYAYRQYSNVAEFEADIFGKVIRRLPQNRYKVYIEGSNNVLFDDKNGMIGFRVNSVITETNSNVRLNVTTETYQNCYIIIDYRDFHNYYYLGLYNPDYWRYVPDDYIAFSGYYSDYQDYYRHNSFRVRRPDGIDGLRYSTFHGRGFRGGGLRKIGW